MLEKIKLNRHLKVKTHFLRYHNRLIYIADSKKFPRVISYFCLPNSVSRITQSHLPLYTSAIRVSPIIFEIREVYFFFRARKIIMILTLTQRIQVIEAEFIE